ncbi:opioid growth factor receptor-related protein [Vibrio parahaemolyticus]
MSTIIEFQLGKGTDSQGRKIDEIWSLNDFWLEHDHKYIQWLFPIDTHTKFNRHAPHLTLEDIETFSNSEVLKQAQRNSLSIMLRFFGMQQDGNRIFATEHLNIRDHIWLKHGGHNHLRISRIIRSLMLCGQPELSKGVQKAMLETAEQFGEVSDVTKNFWLNSNQ